MDAKLLAENLSSSPLIPNHYRAQTIAALGGKVELGELTSKQGGTTIAGLRWENGSHPADPFSFDHLHNYCQRNDIFYTIFPAINNPRRIHIYVQDKDHNNSRSIGITLEGTFAAALILLRNHDAS